MTEIISKSNKDTIEFGKKLAEKMSPGDVYGLVGDLGAGKTALAKGIAKGLGIEEHITSPTFTLVCEYESGRLPLYHFDVYRIDDPEELFEIGFDEYLYKNGVCLIEWADMIRDELPENTIVISIERTGAEDERKIRIQERGRD